MRDDKTPVRIRTKEITGGRKSIYLDIYQEGKRTYEFLRLYLLPPTSRANKDKNKETMMLAEAVRAKRIVEIRNGKFGFNDGRDGGRIRLLDYFRTVAGEKRTGNKRMWLGCLNHLADYERRSTFCVADITPKWLEGFQRYLLTEAKHSKTGERIAQNTACTYYHKLVAMLNQAVREGIIQHNPMKMLDKREKFQPSPEEREFLTIEELRTLIDVPCSNEQVKNAFIFSCFTGLRLSDVRTLTWNKIRTMPDGKTLYVNVVMQKTQKPLNVPLSGAALRVLAEKEDKDEIIFTLPSSDATINYHIKRWVKAGKIAKTISYHCSRHTFATMMLTLGADLYTTSKLRGHANVTTTQIYSKMIDKKKVETVNLVDNLFTPNPDNTENYED